jgi:LmbE family N-acetylglucosaminyl deacetylase
MLKRLIAAMLLIGILAAYAPTALATTAEASNITGTTTILCNGYDDAAFLTDGNTTTYRTSSDECTLVLMNENGIGSVYLMFDVPYGEYVIENAANSAVFTAGTNGYLHECIDLDAAFQGPVTSVTFHFNRGTVKLSEVEVYSPGTVPEHVQTWQPPLEGKTDLLLLSTHGDDDQLFFAGLLPRYAGQEKVAVQVAYLTDHRNLTNQRTHEILNGLWATGCTAYPVMPDFPDFRIDDLKKTYQEFSRLGYAQVDLLNYVVELLRRFKPQVVVGHDIDGEYGHGMHMAYTDCLLQALKVSNDADVFPELAQKYGTWEVPKTYLHLYDQNAIELDYDQPLSAFDGMTAFEVSQKLGYPCHKSQQNTWFTDWINGSDGQITKATQIKRYNPTRFGLYSTTVGPDVEKDDFLENITTYHEQELIEQAKQEQERLEQEAANQERLEQERLELDRIEAEKAEKQRQEQERLERERLEQERLLQEQQQKQKVVITIIAICTLVVAAAVIVIFIFTRRRYY